ncbi:hypothetical protein V6N12_048391 [Hibiscus sabdariffa]|uniref:Uncharacterized protein n=1 Tax=Hibiscus sabdariffa TaxID=183260 RepID=A0ABR2EJI0_9ROSI
MEIRKCKGGCNFHDAEVEYRGMLFLPLHLIMVSKKSGMFESDFASFVSESSVERLGDNIRTAALGHTKENHAAIAEKQIEIHFHPEGTTHLEAWTQLERGHSSSLLGATEALKASTLRLPVVGKAIADIQNLKNAVSSAGDVMQAISSSICVVSSKVEELNSLVAKLASETAKERILLEQCKDFLSVLAAVQVKDSSLRTHIIQQNHVSTTTTHVRN